MKQSLQYILIILLSVASVFSARSEIFAPDSRLKEGKWIKISIGESGLYEVPYSKLKEFGFINPEKVGVFGHGGRMQTEHFTNENGEQTYIDDLTPVAVMHTNDKLIFYGRGVESIGFRSSQNAFMKSERNIYTDFAYYFLSDSADALALNEKEIENPDDSTIPLTAGLDYIYHEKDLSLGAEGTGRLFLGESFIGVNNQRLEWDIKLHDFIVGVPAKMYAGVYVEASRTVNVDYGVDGGNGFSGSFTMARTETDLLPINTQAAEITIPSSDAKVYVNANLISSQVNNTLYCHLDHWILTYTRRIPSLNEESQARISFTSLENGVRYSIPFQQSSVRVMRISDGLADWVGSPSNSRMVFTANENTETLVVFDPNRELLSPLSYTETENSNLHADFDCDIDMLIISLPEYAEGARRLAETDRRLNNVKSAIAFPEEIYNEFAAGNPDAMAYRAFGKMVYEKSNQRLKNILFIGTIRGNVKTDISAGEMPRHLIYYQFKNECRATLGYNAINFYSNFNSYTSASIDRRQLNIGIGLLPVITPYELDRYINKVERYLTSDKNEYFVNHILSAGGSANNHMHVSQADRLDSLINIGSKGRFYFTPIGTSYFDIEQAKTRLRNELGNSAFAFYLGHANPSYIDVEKLISLSDISLLNNIHTPFMAFGGCRLTNTDRGNRGIGEALVLSTEYGLIGSLVTMRETFASPNYGMFTNMVSVLNNPGHDDDSPMSLGEIYARTLSKSSSYNELTYALIGDPSLPLIHATKNITIDNTPTIDSQNGNLEIEGHITNTDGNLAEGFTGEMVVRLLTPTSKVFLAATCETTSKSDSIPYLNYRPPHEVIAMGIAEVENGVFKTSLKVPESAKIYRNEGMKLALGTYSDAMRIGAGITVDVDYSDSTAGGDTPPQSDTTSPIIEQFAYIPDSNAIRVTVSDETALNTSTISFNEGLKLSIDGKFFSQAYRFPKTMEHGRAAYTTDISLPEGTTEGRHQAIVSICDQAGNTATSTLEFTIGEKSTATLEIAEKLAYESATFTLVDATSALPQSTRIFIINSEGEIIRSIPISDATAIWDLLDENGMRVATGLYKAVARGSDASDSYFISSTATIAVL